MGGREEGVGDFCLHFKHPVVGKFTYWLVAACLNGIIWLSSILYLCTHWLLHMTWFLYPPDQQSAHHLFAKKCFRQFFFIFVTKISDYYFVFVIFQTRSFLLGSPIWKPRDHQGHCGRKEGHSPQPYDGKKETLQSACKKK